jgi:hypothetical protein
MKSWLELGKQQRARRNGVYLDGIIVQVTSLCRSGRPTGRRDYLPSLLLTARKPLLLIAASDPEPACDIYRYASI